MKARQLCSAEALLHPKLSATSSFFRSLLISGRNQGNFRNSGFVTDVIFRGEAFLVMIRLHGGAKIRSRMSPSGEAGIQALAFEPPILGIGLPQSL
jgi:hypothetical protein